jgi:alkylated DNA repair dioxygenase AlkB
MNVAAEFAAEEVCSEPVPAGSPPPDSLRLIPLIEPAHAAVLFEQLHRDLAWNDGCYACDGRRFALPRLQAWYSDPGVRYTYARHLMNSHPWTPLLQNLRSRVEAASGHGFNAVLANLYRDGRDHVGWHADDEPDLGPAPVIASLSLGAARALSFRARSGDGTVRGDIVLPPGSLLLMAPAFQRDWEHAVLPHPQVAAPRLNLTFRRVGG